MGVGDNLLASGMARGAAGRGVRIAFGDGNKIIWDHLSETIFRGNPNIAPLGSEGAADLEWIAHYRGNRLYNRQGPGRWIWNEDFRPIPGEVFLSAEERKFARACGQDFIVIEPNVPDWKSCAPNKEWPIDRYNKLARYLTKDGHDVRQFVYPNRRHQIIYLRQVKTPTFRHAMAVLARAKLYIGPEGGLHHAAAALGIPAVVLFGGFIPPQVTGYDGHINLTGGAVACGSLRKCEHCRAAMAAISVDDVHNGALTQLRCRSIPTSPEMNQASGAVAAALR